MFKSRNCILWTLIIKYRKVRTLEAISELVGNLSNLTISFTLCHVLVTRGKPKGKKKKKK